MRNSWPVARLGEVLRKSNEAVELQPDREYREITVKLWGKGVVLRGLVTGTEVAARRRQIAHTGQFILSRIDARNGAFGIVPRDLDEAIVSNDFPVFELNQDRLLPQYLGWLSRTGPFVDRCQRTSEGTTNRVRISEDRFLAIEISLPPLHEQRRIVARIDGLAAMIEEAVAQRQAAIGESQTLLSAYLSQRMEPDRRWVRGTVADVIASMDAGWSPQCEDGAARSGEWGVLKTTSVQWYEFRPEQNKALPRTLKPIPSMTVAEGDVLVTRAGPRKRVGVVAAVRKSEPRLTISDKIIRLRCDPRKISPRFLELCLASPFSQEHLVKRKTGLADAQVNISQSILRFTPVAYPPLAEQARIIADFEMLQTKLSSLRILQIDTATELDALLPSILDRAFNGEL
jgi:type I restriction enzyme S subunit